MRDQESPHYSFWTLPEEDAAVRQERLRRRTKQGLLGSGPAGNASGAVSQTRAPSPDTTHPVPKADVPNRRGSSLPDLGEDRGRRSRCTGRRAGEEAPAQGPEAVAGERLPGSPNAAAASSPPPQELPRAGSRHALPASRSLLAWSAPRDHSPGREVPTAATGPSGLAPQRRPPPTVTQPQSHRRGCGTQNHFLPVPPRPALVPPTAHGFAGQPLQTPALNSFPARAPLPGSSGQSSCALCRPFPPLPFCPEPALPEGRTALGFPESQGLEYTPMSGVGAWFRAPSSLVQMGTQEAKVAFQPLAWPSKPFPSLPT